MRQMTMGLMVAGNYRHGYTGSAIHQTWLSMKRRCDNPHAQNYYLYGGRGIKYEPRWAIFENFLNDMGDKPNSEVSLERVDNEQGYSKENCRWATRIEQANNKRNSRYLDFMGKRLTVSQWAKEVDLQMKTIHQRLSKGWSAERALTEPSFKGKNQYFFNLKKTVSQTSTDTPEYSEADMGW